jgi:hypothetical protein
MPAIQIPVFPIPEKLRFQELPACADVVMRRFPGYPVPVFLLAVAKQSGAGSEMRDPIERMAVMIFDHGLEKAAREALSVIEANDQKRFTKPPNPQKLPELRPQVSLREIFDGLQAARMTTFTVTFKEDEDTTPCFVAFIRSAQSISAFQTEMGKIAATFTSQS